MKKKSLFLPLVAALALTGCSNDDLVIDGGDGANSADRYLAVSILSTDGTSTRATGDPAVGAQYDGKYEDGLAAENKVTDLRVYFFDASGQPVNVKGTGNYYDVPVEEINVVNADANHEGSTVEKKIEAVLIVNTGDIVPSQILAVINKSSELGTDESIDINTLRRKVNDYASFANAEDGKFVMSNSVYLDGGNEIATTAVLPEFYAKSKEEAKANPVTVYVERNVAKVRVNATIANKETLTGGGIKVPVKDKKTNSQYIIKKGDTEIPVYVKFYGWDIAADLKYAYLSKAIRPGWKEAVLGSGNWNDPLNHRSYWADVCGGGTTSTSNLNQYFSYSSANNFNQKTFDGKEWKYCNENGEKFYQGKNETYKNTTVLIKGELCDGEGNSLNITEFAGTRVIDDNFNSLKKNYMLLLKSGRSHSHYKITKNADGKVTKYEEIKEDDIKFITATEKENIGRSTKVTPDNGRYYVYATLSEAASDPSIQWYNNITFTGNKDEDNNDEVTVDEKDKISVNDINNHLLELGHAKIWNSGMTYYYADIMQSSTVPGVVRNHIYDMNLQEVFGIGTPVYNPEELIIPEKPQDDDTYIAAKIMILSWRLVSNNVTLDWD